MAKNLFISYDLHEKGKNYGAVTAAIQSISSRWAKVHYSLWYVQTDLSTTEVAAKVWASMDGNDSLFVVDATTGAASWYNLPEKVSSYLEQSWQTA